MPRSKNQPELDGPLKHPHIELENDDETPLSVIVSSLHKVADGFEKINASGLNRRALVLLLHDATKVKKTDIEAILDAAPLLVERYTTED